MIRRPAIFTLLNQARSTRPELRASRAFAYLPNRTSAFVVIAVLLLASCSSNPPAPVVNLSTTVQAPADEATPRKAASAGATYRVVRGDTLYAIAFRNGVDFRELAAWNGIEPPYRIYAGQDLRLGPLNAQQQSSSRSVAPAPVAPTHPPATAATAAPPVAPTAPANQNGRTSGGMFEDVPATPAVPAEQTTSAPSTTSQRPGSAEIPAAPAAPAVPSTVTEAPAKPAAAPKPPEAVAVNGAGGPAWRWPGKGPLIGSFVAGDQTRQGIDIGGTAGDPVLAAADGEVVYSGNGLLGYGELIIVKHNASFLSAYGHNRKRLVQEGEKIKAGQQIAEMGSSASARDELHFEIRKNGKPVNPIDYLPPR
ncbi:MAG TPA: peptidoglycan DD-metalloendopeptidase family protein [Rhodanobacteraceae bacterium]|nr:peptidoglycan DD-metalloendopeptidase family protein [Rhodanobacteraceae bacterium]